MFMTEGDLSADGGRPKTGSRPSSARPASARGMQDNGYDDDMRNFSMGKMQPPLLEEEDYIGPNGSQSVLDPQQMSQRLQRQREMDRKKMSSRRTNAAGAGMIMATRPTSAGPGGRALGIVETVDPLSNENENSSRTPVTAFSERPGSAMGKTYSNPPFTKDTFESSRPGTANKGDLVSPKGSGGVHQLISERSKSRPEMFAPTSPASRSLTAAEQELAQRGITPVFDPTADNPAPKPQNSLDISDIRGFVSLPAPRNSGVVQCQIVRNKSGTNKMHPKYSLFLKEGDRFLLSARKRKKKQSSNYLVSLSSEDLDRASDKYFGKLRSNFVGTEFVGYDKGVNPKKGDSMTSVNSVRQELCVVLYAYNVLGARGPRKMTALVPKLKDDVNSLIMRPMHSDETMADRYKRNDISDFMILKNKSPKWNEKIGAYCLNFGGRVTKPSVKNFQLVNVEDQEYIILQFGKTSKDTFTMDFQWPLSPLQAFLIALSSFDNKIACE